MTNCEHVALLKQGVTAWNAWRDENPDVLHPNLHGANLIEADLTKADLRKANLREAHRDRLTAGPHGPLHHCRPD